MAVVTRLRLPTISAGLKTPDSIKAITNTPAVESKGSKSNTNLLIYAATLINLVATPVRDSL